jgi:beta-barrel assembly-enhancing protease
VLGADSFLRITGKESQAPLGGSIRRIVGGAMLCLLAVFPLGAQSQRTPEKPGFNLFSTDQDIELGQKYSHEVERKLTMCDDARVDNYLNALGKTLAANAPGAKYPYRYKCVNDNAINAFALPGGLIYINRGAIEAADNEAQLAGVMAHEISHVALRHPTNQLTKRSSLEIGLVLAGDLLGNSSVGSLLTEAGVKGGMGLLTLKLSRTDEGQADILGTQILNDSGYDPRALAQFFEKLKSESKRHPIQFLSDHPNPGNRAERVQEEVRRLGGPPESYRTDTSEFEQIRHIVHDLPQPPKKTSRLKEINTRIGL